MIRRNVPVRFASTKVIRRAARVASGILAALTVAVAGTIAVAAESDGTTSPPTGTGAAGDGSTYPPTGPPSPPSVLAAGGGEGTGTGYPPQVLAAGGGDGSTYPPIGGGGGSAVSPEV